MSDFNIKITGSRDSGRNKEINDYSEKNAEFDNSGLVDNPPPKKIEVPVNSRPRTKSDRKVKIDPRDLSKPSRSNRQLNENQLAFLGCLVSLGIPVFFVGSMYFKSSFDAQFNDGSRYRKEPKSLFVEEFAAPRKPKPKFIPSSKPTKVAKEQRLKDLHQDKTQKAK